MAGIPYIATSPSRTDSTIREESPMSAGVVFVELADADAVGQACSSQFATSGVVIKAGQPYEVRHRPI